MATVLVREIIERASTLLDDMDPQFQGWTERGLVAWLNDGARALAKWLPPSVSRIDTIKLVAGQTRQSLADIPANSIIMGDGSSPVRTQGVQLYELICNMGASGATPGSTIGVVDRATLDALDPAWHTKTGPEVESVLYDVRTPTYFHVSPAPASTLWVQARYCATPSAIVLASANQFAANSADTTAIPVADAYADDLLNYIVARAYLSRPTIAEAQAMASAYTQIFIASVNAQGQALTGNNPNLSMLPFAPAPAGRAG